MRTIKFRGQHLCGQWYYGNLIVRETDSPVPETPLAYKCVYIGDIEDGSEEQVEEETIGQFTGLWDKNGREIYEGDILKVYYYGKSKVFGVVRFDEARFYIDDEFMRNELKVKAPMTELFSHYQFEVIGNVHDNPELLKGGDNE